MNPDRDPSERRAAGSRDLERAGGRDARVEIVPYDPAWPSRFAGESARLSPLAPEITWHHIGSTAVPGLAAKPIIDMMGVAEDLDTPIPALVDQGGYQFPAAYNAELQDRRWLCRPSAQLRTHHLHLVRDEEVLAQHLRFRDALRTDDRLAAAYAALKRDLAERLGHDREAYSAAKGTFVLRTIAGRR